MYRFDDVRLSFEPGTADDIAARVVAFDVTTGRHAEGTFVLPLDADDLAADVGRARSHDREVEPADQGRSTVADAEDVGSRLAAALLDGAVGELYRRALDRVDHQADRGVRLSLSLGRTPHLLDVPWELLYIRPIFLASQQRTPIVRVIENDRLVEPAVVDGPLRILGVVASPTGLATLDVAAERAQVDSATAEMRSRGLVQIDWLDHATPSALRAAMRDRSFHVLHFVGHSDLTSGGSGVLYLEDDDGSPVVVHERLLANLVADQSPTLRLVVLNSCKSGRSTAVDPQAGVASTLMSLGLPAVVGMQRAISDRAAITFAGEMYAGLIGRREPIDAALSEARKAILADVSPTEWATPVLYVRDPAAPLFVFEARADEATSTPPAARTITVTGSGPVAIGGNITISGGIAAGRDVCDPNRPHS